MTSPSVPTLALFICPPPHLMTARCVIQMWIPINFIIKPLFPFMDIPMTHIIIDHSYNLLNTKLKTKSYFILCVTIWMIEKKKCINV